MIIICNIVISFIFHLSRYQSSSILVMAATNRLDSVDAALLRPGETVCVWSCGRGGKRFQGKDYYGAYCCRLALSFLLNSISIYYISCLCNLILIIHVMRKCVCCNDCSVFFSLKIDCWQLYSCYWASPLATAWYYVAYIPNGGIKNVANNCSVCCPVRTLP